MRGAWSRPPAPRASRPRRPRVGGRDQRELPGRAQHLRKLAEMFENEKSNRLSASALPITLQPRHILDKRCFFYQQSDDGEDGDGGVYGWSKLAGHVPSPLYLKLLFLVFNPESIIPVLLPWVDLSFRATAMRLELREMEKPLKLQQQEHKAQPQGPPERTEKRMLQT
ncbi:hypothetical protein AB1E18_011763 [Capra hircus]